MSDKNPATDAQLRSALEEMHLYLSDSIPPLFFADSVQLLLQAPPELVGHQLVAWASNQVHPGAQLPTADYIFHAAKKLHMLAELELLPDDVVKGWIVSLRPSLVEGCPEADRDSLNSDLDRLDLDVAIAPSAGVEVVFRRSGGGGGGTAPVRAAGARTGSSSSGSKVSMQVEEGLRKLENLLQRLNAAHAQTGSVSSEISDESVLTAEILTQATERATNPAELERYFKELQQRGLKATPDTLVRLLAQNLPDWAAPKSAAEEPGEAPQAAVRAMHRFISLAGSREESQKRFDDLVSTAVDEFNRGSLGRSVTLLDLAEQMMNKKEIDGVLAQSVERRAYKSIDLDRLRRLVDEGDDIHLLRRFLDFFSLLSPKQLLEDLEGEEDREKRRYLLELLRVHGPSARELAFAELVRCASGEASFPWYFQRNLVHLLKTIPRGPEDEVDPEIDVLVMVSEINRDYPLVREALSSLGQIQHLRAVNALAARVSEIENVLIDKADEEHDRDQMYFLLDSSVKSLARMDLPEARRAVIAHAMKRKAELGDTLQRLSWLEGQDLSGEPDTVDRLIREIRGEIPKKVFGVSLMKGKKAQSVDSMVQALSSTDTPQVRALLQELGRQSDDQPGATLARRILGDFDRPSTEREPAKEGVEATLSGDLKLFGLPNLLQNLADSQVGGVLRVFDDTGQTEAELWLDDGKVVGARAGRLQGEVAVYQLLEDPAPGRFSLDSPEMPPENSRTGPDPISIQSILFEGIRRYDEFKRAASVVSDEARYRSTGKQPTMGDEEIDPEVFRDIWSHASNGKSAAETESEVLVDRFRVRSLYEHWVAAGALESATEQGSADSSGG